MIIIAIRVAENAMMRLISFPEKKCIKASGVEAGLPVLFVVEG